MCSGRGKPSSKVGARARMSAPGDHAERSIECPRPARPQGIVWKDLNPDREHTAAREESARARVEPGSSGSSLATSPAPPAGAPSTYPLARSEPPPRHHSALVVPSAFAPAFASISGGFASASEDFSAPASDGSCGAVAFAAAACARRAFRS